SERRRGGRCDRHRSRQPARVADQSAGGALGAKKQWRARPLLAKLPHLGNERGRSSTEQALPRRRNVRAGFNVRDTATASRRGYGRAARAFSSWRTSLRWRYSMAPTVRDVMTNDPVAMSWHASVAVAATAMRDLRSGPCV